MSEQRSEGKHRIHWWVTVVAWSIVVALVAVFILQNTRSGKVDFLVWDIRAPAWAWLVGLFACGVLTGWFVKSLRRSRAETH